MNGRWNVRTPCPPGPRSIASRRQGEHDPDRDAGRPGHQGSGPPIATSVRRRTRAGVTRAIARTRSADGRRRRRSGVRAQERRVRVRRPSDSQAHAACRRSRRRERAAAAWRGEDRRACATWDHARRLARSPTRSYYAMAAACARMHRPTRPPPGRQRSHAQIARGGRPVTRSGPEGHHDPREQPRPPTALPPPARPSRSSRPADDPATAPPEPAPAAGARADPTRRPGPRSPSRRRLEPDDLPGNRAAAAPSTAPPP